MIFRTGIICMFTLLYAAAGHGQEIGSISSTPVDPSFERYSTPANKGKNGFLEKYKLSIGTLYKSHHFNDGDYNETHDGIYLNVEGWSFGTFKNSGNVQSLFLTYNPLLYQRESLQVNLVAGLADGYRDWDLAQGDYLPILGVSAKWHLLKTVVSYDVIAFGLELPLN